MDTILTGLLNLGVGGAMAAAVIYLVWYTLTRTIPEQQRLHRVELSEQRERYHQLLHTEHETFRESLAAAESRGLAAAAQVCQALQELGREVTEQSRQLAALTVLIQRCHREESHDG